jgi:hypothetical protein
MRVMFSLAVRTWLRYVAPFALLGVVATVPVAMLAKLAPTLEPAQARWRLTIGVALAIAAYFTQVWLAAAVAPAMRSVARGAPLSQRRALVDGASQLVHAIVPVAVMAAAAVIGGVALVVPGLALLVLLAQTGTSERLREPLPAPLADSVAVVRTAFWSTAAIVAVAFVGDIVLANSDQLALFGQIPRKNPSPAIVSAMKIKPYVLIAFAAISSLVACALSARGTQRS